MKLGTTYQQQLERKRVEDARRETPHRWFAWHPVWVEDGRIVWLETVIRYQAYYWTEDYRRNTWQYQAIPNE